MEKRPKLLSPSLRSRKRYLAFQVFSEEKIKYEDLSNSIWHSLLNLLGEIGTSKAELWIVKNLYNDQKQLGLIRCSHMMVEQVRTALALIERIGDTRIIVNILGVSGTMKAARKKFFGETDLKDFT